MKRPDLWHAPDVDLSGITPVAVKPPPVRARVKLQRRASPTTIALRAACWRLGIETRTTADQRERAYLELPNIRLQTKGDLARARKASRMIDASRDSASMMRAGHPARMPSTVQRDERTQSLFRAHERRQSAGWIRG